MSYSDDDLNYIYDKTGGYCYYCGKKMDWSNYGQPGAKGSWEVDHKTPLSRVAAILLVTWSQLAQIAIEVKET